jgi:hypothetical protein
MVPFYHRFTIVFFGRLVDHASCVVKTNKAKLHKNDKETRLPLLWHGGCCGRKKQKGTPFDSHNHMDVHPPKPKTFG